MSIQLPMSFFSPRARSRGRVLLPNNLPNRAGALLARLALCLFSSLLPFQFSPEKEKEKSVLYTYIRWWHAEKDIYSLLSLFVNAHIFVIPLVILSFFYIYNIICIHKYIYIYITWYVVVITEDSNLMRFAERKKKHGSWNQIRSAWGSSSSTI